MAGETAFFHHMVALQLYGHMIDAELLGQGLAKGGQDLLLSFPIEIIADHHMATHSFEVGGYAPDMEVVDGGYPWDLGHATP